tara:strand:+ start:102 stop:302 length:201 start_codon:yes stop_codon:yes gene_type:complete
MSYHDSNYHPELNDKYYSDLEDKGISVVNPLHEQRKRLTQLEEFLAEIAEETNDEKLKSKINDILK